MNGIKRNCRILGIGAGFLLLWGVILLIIEGFLDGRHPTVMVIGSLLLIGGFGTAVFFGAAYRKLKFARLIGENPILQIRTAVITDLSEEGQKEKTIDEMDVIVSYFGILLGSRLIKFNLDGIRLKAVELDEDSISFTYGVGSQARNIRLLRPEIDPERISELIERFRYETGVIPTVNR